MLVQFKTVFLLLTSKIQDLPLQILYDGILVTFNNESLTHSDKRAYIHENSGSLLYYVTGHWCLTSAYYNYITSCDEGLGFYRTIRDSCRGDVLQCRSWNEEHVITGDDD